MLQGRSQQAAQSASQDDNFRASNPGSGAQSRQRSGRSDRGTTEKKSMMHNAFQHKFSNYKEKRMEECKRVFDNLYQKNAEEESKRNYFHAKYLQQGSNSHDFLQKVVDFAPLRDLKHVIWSTHYDQNLAFSAALVEIRDRQLQELSGGNFSLEVWSNGIMLFQRQLTRKPRAWNACRQQNSIIFLLAPEDETCEGDVIHILSLNDACQKDDLDSLTNLVEIITEVKIRDWTGLCANQDNMRDIQFGLDKNNTLYLSTPQVLHAVSLVDLQGDTSINMIGGLRNFGPGTRSGKLDFSDDFCCLNQYDSEDSFARADGFSRIAIFDNGGVADFNIIMAQPDEQDEKKLNLRLMQLVEVAQEALISKQNSITSALRNLAKKDQIKELKHIILCGRRQASVVLRQSGNVDLYWNFKKISSTKDLGEPFTYVAIDMNYETVLLRRFGQDIGQHQVVLSLQQEQRTSFANLTMIPDYDIDEKAFFLNQKYKKLLNPYQEMFLHNKTMLVAHGNILSYFSMATKRWICHHKFAEDDEDGTPNGNVSFAYATKKKVLRMFRYDGDDSDFSIGILFQDGTFKRIVVEQNQKGQDIFEEQSVEGQIDGQMVSIASDREHQRILYVISVVNDQAKLWGFSKGKLRELTKARVTPCAKIVPYFAPAANTQVVIMEPDKNFFRIYQHQVVTGEDGESTFDVKLIKRVYEEELAKRVCMRSLHSIVATKNEELIIFFDEKDMHVYDMRTAVLDREVSGYRVSGVTTHQEQNIRGLQLLEDRYMYVMYNQKGPNMDMSSLGPEQRSKLAAINNTSGLGFIDLETLLYNQVQQPMIIPIMSAICGVNSEIMYSESSKKIVIMQGFNRIAILPILHLNILPFEGMQQKQNYLFAKQFNDKFVALDAQKNNLWTWDIQSGKFTDTRAKEKFRISEYVPSCGMAGNCDFEVYRSMGETPENQRSIYDQGILPYTLLNFKLEDTMMTCSSFFKDRIKRRANQISHLERHTKKFYTFVVVGLSDRGDMEVKVHFSYPKVLNKSQHLFISDDYTRLLDVQSDQASIFMIEKGNNGLAATAQFEGHVRRMPYGIFDRDPNQLACLFSPDFSKHIDTDPIHKQWIIRESLTGQVFFTIPSTFLSYNPKNRRQVVQQARFMAWENNTQLSVIDVNADPFIHEIIELPETKDEPYRMSYEVASGAEPYVDMEPYSHSYLLKSDEARPIGAFNYFKGNLKMDVNDVIPRLKRMHRVLKNIWYLQQSENSIEYEVENQLDTRFENTYKHLFRVDYISDPDRLFIELPFTFIMHRKIEMLAILCAQPTLQATTAALSLPFTADIVEKMCLSILPDCQSILHKITRNYEFLEQFLKFAQGKDGATDSFVVPFIEDMDGKTALHISTEPETGNSRTTEYFLTKFLPGMPFDHHGRAICDVIPQLVEQELPFLGAYFDSRLITTLQMKKVGRQDKKTIKQKMGETGDEKQYVTVCDIWPDENLVIDRVLEDSTNGQEICISILDLPKLHNPQNPTARELANALAGVDDKSIFQYKAIRSIVSFRWGLTKSYVLRKQMLPYCGFFLSFLIYAFVILPYDRNFRATQPEDREFPIIFTIFDKLWLLELACFSCYFLKNEWRQIKSAGWSYLSSFWNYTDIVPPLGIIIIACLDFFTGKQADTITTIRFSLQGVVCFGMWLKIFYFLRIFRNTGFFVNMFLNVIYQIRIFGLLYLLILCAFAFTFYIQAPEGLNPWYFLNQTYLIGLGADDMDWSEFAAPAFMQIFYLGGTLVITIIMLNLLIAIVSEAYEDVIQSQQEANDFERTQLIAEVADFIDEQKQMDLVLPNEYLIRATIAEYNCEENIAQGKST